METEYNKLVRGRIPEIIKSNGGEPVTRILGDSAYRKALLDKLVEEAIELRDSDGDPEERADVAEVLKALDPVLGISLEELETIRAQKAEKRGGFEGKIWLERVDE